ncbi:unnamed protein product [Adineta ricciae]|uniref:Uncharacterized protein n=1 Tax=Adineta ricciae TaxID=249248 RepID=A0A815FEB8_ADIRI|nr:unnamed protein product [Adineta ricciae]
MPFSTDVCWGIFLTRNLATIISSLESKCTSISTTMCDSRARCMKTISNTVIVINIIFVSQYHLHTLETYFSTPSLFLSSNNIPLPMYS